VIQEKSAMPMRLLLLLRHAKAARDAADKQDHSRPLNERGHAAATAIGRWLADRPAIQPELALVSTAQRTRETWHDLADMLPGTVPVRYERALYLAAPNAALDAIAGVPNDVDRVMVIAHNPGIHELACSLVGRIGARPAARLAFDHMRESFPSGSLAVLAFPRIRNWADVAPGKGRFEAFTRPRDAS
jgi:phosphohistidine phosphatase